MRWKRRRMPIRQRRRRERRWKRRACARLVFWAGSRPERAAAGDGCAATAPLLYSECKRKIRGGKNMHDIDRTQIGREMETFEYPQGGRVFSEAQEMELASELLEVNSEAELERFLGDLISKAGKAVGSFVSSPTGQALGGMLKSAAGKLIPAAGSAIGGYFGGPTGAQIGGQLAQK